MGVRDRGKGQSSHRAEYWQGPDAERVPGGAAVARAHVDTRAAVALLARRTQIDTVHRPACASGALSHRSALHTHTPHTFLEFPEMDHVLCLSLTLHEA